MTPGKGRGDQPFVPVSKDKQREAELKFCGFKWITKGQTMPNSNGNFLMQCRLCGQGFQGSQTKVAQHFTIKNNCAKISVEQMAEIWNKTKYGFNPSHHRKIVDFLKSRGFRDNICGSGREPTGKEEFEDSEEERRAVEGGDDDGESDAEDMEVRREVERARGKMRKEKVVDEDSTPDEDDDDGDDDDQGAYLGASLDRGLMGDGRRGQEGAARAMKEAAGSKKRKRKARKTATEARSAPSQPKKSRVLRQTSMLETFDPVWQREFSDSVLQWWDIEATGATILTDGRKSITSDQIVNFLTAGPTGAYLFRTVQRDGAVQETAEAVVEQWKDVFDKFGVEKVNAICTYSASAYVAASKLLAEEEVKYNRITWLPCAVHVCNLLLSDIAKDGRDGSLGKREDTIIRARAVVRFIREHRAALSLYRRFSAAHPSSASAAAGGSSSAPSASQRRGRELVHLLQTRFATHYLILERLLNRRRALEALMMSDDWLRTAWRWSIFLQARWLLRRLDRGGRVMTRMWSWGFVMVDRVARASLNKTSKDELHINVQACQARVAHMLEPAHCMAHLLNPRHRNITFLGAARRTDHERILEDESLRYLRRQTGGDEDLYQTLCTQLAEFHSREGDWTYGGVEGDRDAAACKGEKETLQPWSDPDDLAVESEFGGSDDDDNDTPLIQIPRPRTRASPTAAAPSPAARPPSSAPDVSHRGPADRVESTTPHPSTDRRGQGGICERGDEGDDDNGDDREGYEGSSEDEDDPCYSPMRGDGDDDDDEGGDGGQAVGGLRKSERQRGDRCNGAGSGGRGPGVGGGGRTSGAGRAGRGAVRRESTSSTRTVHWVDEGRPVEAAVVAPSPVEVALSPAEFAAASIEGAPVSAEGAGGFAGGSGDAGEVERSSAQLGVSFSDSIFDVLLGHPPTPAGERVGVNADAAVAPSVASRARVARMLETGVEAGVAEGECGGVGIGDAGERPASPVQGVCVLPLGGAMSAGELKRQALEDPLQADRRGRMAEASRRLMAEGPAYVPCSPSVPSSTTGVSTPAHMEALEGTGAAKATRGPSPTPARESPSPESWKKKMRAGKSLSTERVSDRATDQPMSAPAEATLPHTAGRTAATGDHAEHNAPPGRSMAARILREDVRPETKQRPSQARVVWESGIDDLEMPYGQRRRVSVYDLLRPQGGVEAAPKGEIHAPDTTHAPAGGTGRGDGVTGVVPQRRRKDIVDDDDA
ncbi:hypothetical protein CBR_g25822 [Chara braunii]|uniref:DUF659 domain-containing protein n=1 Tax=Chara braunii TaxID=69332 RepID=A0A388L6F9_CHABU|nr:hypothetical protein CBR_g25822 [Chara braunii]|eukprot:GBG77890.1 hypothetical protein CBR_g25822 [Chara braunii]